MSTPTTTHRPGPIEIVPADENGRRNLAGHRSTCTCGLEMTNTSRLSLAIDVDQHQAWHLSKQGRAADARRELRTIAGWTDGITTDDEALEALAYARGEA